MTRRVSVLASALVAVALFSGAPPPSFAATEVTGAISASATWSPSGSPYLLSGTVTVGAGAALTAPAGTVVKGGAGGAQRGHRGQTLDLPETRGNEHKAVFQGDGDRERCLLYLALATSRYGARMVVSAAVHPWSSGRAYAGPTPAPEWLHGDRRLEQFGELEDVEQAIDGSPRQASRWNRRTRWTLAWDPRSRAARDSAKRSSAKIGPRTATCRR